MRISKRQLKVLCLSMVLILGGAILGSAQETEKEKGQEILELEDIVVMAPEVKGAPGRTTEVTKEEIDLKNIQDASEIIEGIPGVYLRKNTTRGGQINMRGVTEAKTVILLDDSILGDSFTQSVYWNIIPIDAIERVEVIPGPFSALYGGRGAIGGTVRFITKMPEEEETFVKGSYGSNNTIRGVASYGNKFKDKVSVYLNFNYMGTDGDVINYITKSANDGAGGIPVTGWEKTTDSQGNPMYLIGDRGDYEQWQWNVLSKLKYDFSDTSNIAFTFKPSQWNYGGSRVVNDPNSYLRNANTGEPVTSGNVTFYDDGVQKNIDLGTNTFLGGIVEDSERYCYTLVYETEFTPDFNLRATAEYVDETNRGVDSTALAGATASGGPGRLQSFPFERWQGKIVSEIKDIAGFNNITFGVDYMSENGGRRNYNEMPDWRDTSNTGPLSAKSDGYNNVYSLFIQDEMFLMDERLTLYLGGRLDYWEVTDLMDWTTNADAGTNEYPDRDETYFSPKVSIKYRALDSTTLRVSLANAFTAPRLHDIVGGYAPNAYTMRLSSPYLKPEKATCWEFGLDQKIFGKTHLRATYYENYLRDYMYRVTWIEDGYSYNQTRTGGESEIKGIELGIKHQITPFLSAEANMTYQDTEVTKNVLDPEVEGKQMTNVPKEMYNFSLLLGNYAGFNGSITGRYVGKVYANAKNLDTENDVLGSYDPYFTMDAKVGYEIKEGLMVSFAVDNIFDKEYYQNFKAPGREFFGEVSYRF